MYSEYAIWKQSKSESVSFAKSLQVIWNPVLLGHHAARRDARLLHPCTKAQPESGTEAMRAAARDLDQMIASWGASEDKLMEEYKGSAGVPARKSGMPSKALVVDANILVRAVLGKRVREVIEAYAEDVTFFVPEVALSEAEEHLPALVTKHGGEPEKALRLLRTLGRLVEVVGSDVYGEFEADARERLGKRDPEDWPILAARRVGCPIWTEDTDFFGCGVATWTSSSVKHCAALRSSQECRDSESGLRPSWSG